MRIDVGNWLRSIKRKKTIQLLKTLDSEKLIAFGQREAIAAFQRTAARVSAYHSILKQRKVHIEDIRSPESFRNKVPILSKEDLFPNFPVDQLCLDGAIEKTHAPMTSSGFSGIFSYGINTKQNSERARESIDTALDYVFDISHRKTLLINAVPMGVKIPTFLPCADTSVRSDMALSILQEFHRYYDQLIIVSDPHFHKKMLEDGLEKGMDWKHIPVHLICGEDWMPETLRSYFERILETDWNSKKGMILNTMGIAELDLNLFHESPFTVKLRKTVQKDKQLALALGITENEAIPVFFHYYPHKTHIEILPHHPSAPWGDLVFTMLSKTLLIPLVRYNSKDRGFILLPKTLRTILDRHGYPALEQDLQLPVVALSGRKTNILEFPEGRITPERVRECLYEDPELARAVTGQFLIKKNQPRLAITIQLKRNFAAEDDEAKRIARVLQSGLKRWKPEIQLKNYFDFTHGMTVDYETKFRHIV